MAMQWHGDKTIPQLEKELKRNLEKAAIFVKGEVKDSLNVSQPYTVYHGVKGDYYKGLDPSQPGDPPHKVRGDLQRSIAHEMSEDKLTAAIGSNMEVAKWLELGTLQMAARPFLRPAMEKNKDTIERIVATGKR